MHVNKKISPHMSKNNMTSSHVNCKMTATHACTVLYKHKIGVTQVKKQMAATQVTKKITFIGRVGGYCGVSPPDCYVHMYVKLPVGFQVQILHYPVMLYRKISAFTNIIFIFFLTNFEALDSFVANTIFVHTVLSCGWYEVNIQIKYILRIWTYYTYCLYE